MKLEKNKLIMTNEIYSQFLVNLSECKNSYRENKSKVPVGASYFQVMDYPLVVDSEFTTPAIGKFIFQNNDYEHQFEELFLISYSVKVGLLTPPEMLAQARQYIGEQVHTSKLSFLALSLITPDQLPPSYLQQ